VSNEEPTIGQLLDEIIKKVGPYNRDERQFMDNVITKASNNAYLVKERILEAINSLIDEVEENEDIDIEQGLYALLESCGGFRETSEPEICVQTDKEAKPQ
jgi:hypothetical protein